MLTAMCIENVAIAERVDFALEPGLNVLTGETGAGKSIVLGSLDVLLGRPASSGMVRTGAATALVRGVFAASEATRRRLGAADLPDDAELVIERVLGARGSGRVTVNGASSTLLVVRRLGGLLVDLAGQHAAQRLRDPDEHRRLVDEAGEHADRLARMGERYRAWTAARRQLGALEDVARHAVERGEWLRYQLRELEALRLQAGEPDDLEIERRVLRHTAEVSGGLSRARGWLLGDAGVVARLGRAEGVLRGLGEIDPQYAACADRLVEALACLEDVDRVLVEPDPAAPGRLDAVEGRLAEIDRLARKHRCVPEALVSLRAGLAGELDSVEHVDDRLAEARAVLAAARAEAEAEADALRVARRSAGGALAARVQAQLRGLAMPHAHVTVQVTDVEAPDGLSETGRDAVDVCLSANPGEEPRSVAKVASGGELSRLLLALRLGMGAGGAPLAVFDEVDAGLGGAAAAEVGRRLLALSGTRQVLCVTHLPQVASLAHAHLMVEKSVAGGRTRSRVTSLEADGRIRELARMVGGSAHDPAALAYARELLRARAAA